MFARFKSLLLENRGTRQTIVKNVFWLSFGNIMSRVIRAGVIIYAARVLGAADYGVFSYALSLAAFFTVFGDIGLNAVLTREVAQHPEERLTYFATSFWMKLVLLAGIALVIIFVAPALSNIDAVRPLIPLIALLTFFDSFREFGNSFLRARERMEREAFVNITTNIVITGVGIGTLLFAVGVEPITIAYVVSTGVGALIGGFVLRDELRAIFTHVKVALMKPLIMASIPMALIGLLGAFMLNTDMVMLAWWRPAAELGFYAAAQKIILVLYILPGIVGAAVFPAVSRLVSSDADRAKAGRLAERAMATLYFLAVPLAAGGIVLAEPIISFVFGAEYLPAAGAFRILCATLLIVFPGTLLGNLVLAYNRQKEVVWFVAAGGIGNILFNALLIPPFGIVGCSIATIIAQLVDNGAMWRFVKKASNFRTLTHLKKIVPAGLLMAAVAFGLNALHLHVLLTIALSGIIYLGALAIFKENVIEQVKGLLAEARGTVSAAPIITE